MDESAPLSMSAANAATALSPTLASQSGILFALAQDDTSMGDGSPSSEQPLETPLTTQQLQTCIDFMAHHEHKRLPEIERPLKSVDLSDLVPAWDVKFVDLDLEALYLIMHAANFLDIRPLLDLACAKVASFLKGRTTVEIRKVLGIKSDYTKAEEEAVREENKWCEEAP